MVCGGGPCVPSLGVRASRAPARIPPRGVHPEPAHPPTHPMLPPPHLRHLLCDVVGVGLVRDGYQDLNLHSTTHSHITHPVQTSHCTLPPARECLHIPLHTPHPQPIHPTPTQPNPTRNPTRPPAHPTHLELLEVGWVLVAAEEVGVELQSRGGHKQGRGYEQRSQQGEQQQQQHSSTGAQGAAQQEQWSEAAGCMTTPPCAMAGAECARTTLAPKHPARRPRRASGPPTRCRPLLPPAPKPTCEKTEGCRCARTRKLDSTANTISGSRPSASVCSGSRSASSACWCCGSGVGWGVGREGSGSCAWSAGRGTRREEARRGGQGGERCNPPARPGVPGEVGRGATVHGAWVPGRGERGRLPQCQCARPDALHAPAQHHVRDKTLHARPPPQQHPRVQHPLEQAPQQQPCSTLGCSTLWSRPLSSSHVAPSGAAPRGAAP